MVVIQDVVLCLVNWAAELADDQPAVWAGLGVVPSVFPDLGVTADAAKPLAGE